jgi:hypothetical protein
MGREECHEQYQSDSFESRKVNNPVGNFQSGGFKVRLYLGNLGPVDELTIMQYGLEYFSSNQSRRPSSSA